MFADGNSGTDFTNNSFLDPNQEPSNAYFTVLLYVTFFGCLTWGSIFFVGPVLIRHLIVMYSDGVITPGKVILFPNLM